MAPHCAGRVPSSCGNCFSPTADSAGVSAQIGSGVGGSEEVSTRVPREFCESCKSSGKIPFCKVHRAVPRRVPGGFREGYGGCGAVGDIA